MRANIYKCLPEGQQFGVSSYVLQHSFHQLFVFLRIHWARAVDHCLNPCDWQKDTHKRIIILSSALTMLINCQQQKNMTEQYRKLCSTVFLRILYGHPLNSSSLLCISECSVYFFKAWEDFMCLCVYILIIFYMCVCMWNKHIVGSQERAWASSRACRVAIVCILLWDTEPRDKSSSRSKSVNKMKIF